METSLSIARYPIDIQTLCISVNMVVYNSPSLFINMIIPRISTILTVVFSLLIVGCASPEKQSNLNKQKPRQYVVHSTLYRLSDGKTIKITTKKVNSSRVEVVKTESETGEEFSGEFIIIDNSTYEIRTEVIPAQIGTWERTRKIRTFEDVTGTGVLVGKKGTLINIEYIISDRNAIGEGVDNKGEYYKFQCCRIEYLPE